MEKEMLSLWSAMYNIISGIIQLIVDIVELTFIKK